MPRRRWHPGGGRARLQAAVLDERRRLKQRAPAADVAGRTMSPADVKRALQSVPMSPAGPVSSLARLRLLALVLAVASAAVTIPPIVSSGRPVELKLAGTLLAAGLAGAWIRGYRRDGFSLPFEIPEFAAVFA